MASITQDPSSGVYYVRFRHAGASYKRSLSTSDQHQAVAVCERVRETIRDIKRGRLAVPEDADPGLFIISDGKVVKKAEAPEVRTINDLFLVYEENLPTGAKEESTLQGERIHMKHLRKHLGPRRAVRGMQTHDLQKYVARRSKDQWNDRPISGDTIRKEITTFRLIWNWAVGQGYPLA